LLLILPQLLLVVAVVAVVVVVAVVAVVVVIVVVVVVVVVFRFLFLHRSILVSVVVDWMNERKASFITLNIGEKKFFSMRSFPLGFPRSPRSTHLT